MKIKQLKIDYTGKNLLQLREEFGIGANGFYDNNWWFKEDFAKESPERGLYELDLSNTLVDLIFEEQKKKIKKGFGVAHPAIVAEAILTHFREKKERLCKNYWLRTSSVDSVGSRVGVGRFDSDGLFVNDYWDGPRYVSVGAAAARKLRSLESRTIDPLESSNLKSRIKELEDFRERVEKILKV